MNDSRFLGLQLRTWGIIAAIAVIASVVIFLFLPFLLSTIFQLIDEDSSKISPFQTFLNGITLLLSVVGTIASIVSIVMTSKDSKRYENEKIETDKLMSSLAELHDELQTVNTCVTKTFDQNQALACALYDNSIIKVNPDSAGFGLFKGRSKNNWDQRDCAEETDTDKRANTQSKTSAANGSPKKPIAPSSSNRKNKR